MRKPQQQKTFFVGHTLYARTSDSGATDLAA